MYHVNPKTGEVGTCHAKSPETCPFGSFNHSDNLDNIQMKADIINKWNVITKDYQFNNKKRKPYKERVKELIDKSFTSFYIVEFNETDENMPDFEGEILTPELVDLITKMDSNLEQKDRYYKFYIDEIYHGEVENHNRIDLGDGFDVNKESFNYYKDKAKLQEKQFTEYISKKQPQKKIDKLTFNELLKNDNIENVDLSDLKLSNIDLSNKKIDNVTFGKFNNLTIKDGSLTNCTFTQDFKKLNVSNSVISFNDIDNVKFNNIDFKNNKISELNINNCQGNKVDLTGSNVFRSSLENIKCNELIGNDIDNNESEIEYRNVVIKDCNTKLNKFEKIDFIDSQIINIKTDKPESGYSTSFYNSSFTDGKVSNNNLDYSNFSNVFFNCTNFNDNQVSNSDFSEAKFVGGSLSNTNFRKSILHDAHFDDNFMKNTNFGNLIDTKRLKLFNSVDFSDSISPPIVTDRTSYPANGEIVDI